MADLSERVHTARTCDAALDRAFRLFGRRWTGIILGTLMQGPAGFAELGRTVPGIHDSVLWQRLSELTTAGLVHRSVDEGPPLSVQYALTSSGRALQPTLSELAGWARGNWPV